MMKSQIRILDEHTINQIAAGEVIENPASVIKELVDNSIDSGAKEIHIEIQGGGRQLIRVVDDGCGMSSDDAILSFERHATSKIKSMDDINFLSSMGFRGEAVPSIASISKYTLLTRPHSEDTKGTMVIVDGGKILKHCEVACAVGSTVEVKSLFFNLPVRKKFQRSPKFDTHEILKLVSKFALAYPEIKFVLTSDCQQILLARRILSDDKEKQMTERVSDVLGPQFLSECTYVQHRFGNHCIQGLIGLPLHTKHNRSNQYLFINKRAVFCPLVHNAVREGFGTMLQATRHPQFIIHLMLPGELVDVNVHPQKKEVRLRQESELKKALIQAVDQTLHRSGITSKMCIEPEIGSIEKHGTDTFAGFSLNPDHFLMPKFSNAIDLPFERPPTIAIEEKPKENVQEGRSFVSESQENFISFTEDLKPKINVPRVLATISGYLLLESIKDDGFALVDQKLAHARVIFEQIKESGGIHSNEIQSLLVPYTISTTTQEASALLLVIDALNRLGIHMKEFGKNTFIIDAIPTVFGKIDVEAFTRELLFSFSDEITVDFQMEIDKRLASSASRNSLSMKTKLSTCEAQNLVDKLFNCSHPYLCPFGKPTIMHLNHRDIARYFET